MMLKKYLIMGIGFFLLAVLYGFFLIPLIAVRNNVEQQYLLLGIEIWGGCCLISFLPLVNSIIKKMLGNLRQPCWR